MILVHTNSCIPNYFFSFLKESVVSHKHILPSLLFCCLAWKYPQTIFKQDCALFFLDKWQVQQTFSRKCDRICNAKSIIFKILVLLISELQKLGNFHK